MRLFENDEEKIRMMVRKAGELMVAGWMVNASAYVG